MSLDRNEPILTTQISYREWLVGLITQGIVANPELTQLCPEDVVVMASRVAFAVIENLNSEVKDAN